MAENVFVIERIEWEHAEAIEGKDSWNDSEIIRVFRSWEDAKSFCEKNSKHYPYTFHWHPDCEGSRLYSARIRYEDEGVEEGVKYVLHCVACT